MRGKQALSTAALNPFSPAFDNVFCTRGSLETTWLVFESLFSVSSCWEAPVEVG